MKRKMSGLSALWSWLWRPSARYPVIAIGAAAFAGGIIFWGGFNTAMEATNTLGFCITCHEMRDNVYKEYASTIHHQNRTGVQATCSNCHVPDPWVHKVVRKIQATNELFHWAMGSIDSPEKFEAKRLALAQRVWASMKATDSRECRNCHTLESMNPEFQRPRARKLHMDAMQAGQTCIDCHKGIAHKSPRHLVAEAELDRMEKPDPAFIRTVPASYLAGLKRVEAREAEEAARKQQEAQAAEAAMKARIDQAVAQALAARPGAAAPSATAPTAAAVAAPAAQAVASASGSGVDWSGVEATTVTLFYPGQASFEWIQTSRDHGGARAFLRAGDRCSSCHLKEAKDIGTKIASGQKLEPTPIPNKRPFIDLKVQATHDGDNVHLRFEWPDAPHTPAPFVDGGKMDPQNPVKLAMMIAGTGIQRVDQAGCWATCHHDSRTMPNAPKADILSAGPLAKLLNLKDGVTKYLPESRTQIEVQGGDDKPRGGWDKPKSADELAALTAAGTFMDLIRYRADGKTENGHVLAERVMEGGGPVEATGKAENGAWTVTMKLPVKSGKPGDVGLEPGKTYTVGFAIHDDYTSARFHHVSFEYRFGLDSAEAEINAKKR